MAQHPFEKFMVTFQAGDRIFAEGEQGTTMFVVQGGKVQLDRDVAGKAQSLGVLEKGDFFGEMSILEGMPRTVSARAIENAQLIEIDSSIFDKMIRGNIEIAIRMLRKLSIRCREAEMKISELQASGARLSQPASAAKAEAADATERADSGVRLVTEDGSVALPVGDDETMIGRYDPVTELRPDIDLTELDFKRTVSRRHARIIHAKGAYFVMEEVGALNGTFVNGVQLVSGGRHPLANGDKLDVGAVSMVFHT
jgi:CRP-like cAMP-binding protein